MSELLSFVKILGAFSVVIIIFYVIALSSCIVMACSTVKMIDIVEKFMEAN